MQRQRGCVGWAADFDSSGAEGRPVPSLGNCQEHILSAAVTLGSIGKYQNGHKAKRLLRQQQAWCLAGTIQRWGWAVPLSICICTDAGPPSWWGTVVALDTLSTNSRLSQKIQGNGGDSSV